MPVRRRPPKPKTSGTAGLRWEQAADIRRRLGRTARAVGFRHVDPRRLVAVRTYGSRANALARIWGLSPIFQQALRLPAPYVVDVMIPAVARRPPPPLRPPPPGRPPLPPPPGHPPGGVGAGATQTPPR